MCVALLNFPIEAYQDFLHTAFSGQLANLLDAITAATLDIIALVVLLAVSYSYVKDELLVKTGEVHPLLPVITTFCCYTTMFVEMYGINSAAISSPGRNGTLFALVMALIVPWLFFAILKLRTKISPPKVSSLDSNLLVRTAFRVTFPMIATILIFVVLNLFVVESPTFDFLRTEFEHFATNYLGKEDFASVILTVIVMQLMWFVGIQGGGVVFEDIMMNATLSNASSMFATQDFYYTFVNIGGAGALLGLLVTLLIFRPGHREKRLAKISAAPLLFNVNETLVFGMPIIFNPFYVIPFVLGPVLIAAVSYAAFAFGMVPPMTSHVDWTTPIILSGFMATGSIAGVILQLVCLVCAVAIYTPFVIGHRRSLLRHQGERISEMQKAITKAANTEGMTIILRDDVIGNTAREISRYIHSCFESGEPPFKLVYQPKTDIYGNALGAEALLRWNHRDYGSISPVVLVELCNEDGLGTELGRWVTAKGIREYARWKELGLKNLHLSINLDPFHLKDDKNFISFLAYQMRKYKLGPGEIELEITEHMAINSDAASRITFEKIRRLGIELSIDDMGIGYSSLTYISDFGARCIKVDMSLVSEVETDFQQQEIIRSIVYLAKQLSLYVVIEGVETKEQLDVLVALGANRFQGYYFSKPLSPNDFVEYARGYRGASHSKPFQKSKSEITK
jgi:lactose/cellobiose-specific phosphotransferase system IIC component